MNTIQFLFCNWRSIDFNLLLFEEDYFDFTLPKRIKNVIGTCQYIYFFYFISKNEKLANCFSYC